MPSKSSPCPVLFINMFIYFEKDLPLNTKWSGLEWLTELWCLNSMHLVIFQFALKCTTAQILILLHSTCISVTVEGEVAKWNAY